MSDTNSSVARTSARTSVRLSVRVRVDPIEAPLVRFVPGITDEDGWLEATAVDISEGGMGIELAEYLPRGADVWIAMDGDDEIEFRARVRRVRAQAAGMGYEIGTAFETISDRSLRRIREEMARSNSGVTG